MLYTHDLNSAENTGLQLWLSHLAGAEEQSAVNGWCVAVLENTVVPWLQFYILL